jgi:hypothetical protein
MQICEYVKKTVLELGFMGFMGFMGFRDLPNANAKFIPHMANVTPPLEMPQANTQYRKNRKERKTKIQHPVHSVGEMGKALETEKCI